MSVSAQVLEALNSAFSPNPDVRQAGEAQLLQMKQSSAEVFFTSCVEILTTPSCPLLGRELSGFQLKNNLAHPACANSPSIAGAIMNAGICDPERKIRKVSSSIVAKAVREAHWPARELVPHLCSILKQGLSMEPSAALTTVHGTMLAVSKIIDDCVSMIDAMQVTPIVLESTLPLLGFSFGNSAEAVEIRLMALDITAAVLEQAGTDLESISYRSTKSFALTVIQSCFENLQSPLSNDIAARCISCIVFSLIHEDQIDASLFQTILQLMIKATTESGGVEEDLRIAAVSFWSAVLRFPRFAELATIQIQQIIPTLIRSMIYSDMEIGMLAGTDNDWQVEDKEDEIRPRHYQSKVQSTNDEDDDDDADDEVEEWNLRRVSARTLDDISAYYGEPILEPALRIITEWMNPNREWSSPQDGWKYLEASILALGAITEGCLHTMGPHLHVLSNQLLSLIEMPQTHFLVVCISFWTSSQLIQFFVSEPALLNRFIQQILARMQSPSKKVQESATSALETVLDACEVETLEPYAPGIIEACSACLGGYQLKNRLLLLEVIGPFCEKLGPIIRYNDTLVSRLLDRIGEMWVSIPDNSILLFSVFSCMSCVCNAFGSVMRPEMVNEIFTRGLKQLVSNMNALLTSDDAPEFIVTAAELISGLLDGLGAGLEPHVKPHQIPFMEVVMAMLRVSQHPNIRQSGFSLCGDINKGFPTYMQQVLQPYCEAVLLNLSAVNEETYRVVSNLAWSISNLLENEVAMDGLPMLCGSPMADKIYTTMASILVTSELTADMRNMADNIVLALGMMLSVDAAIAQRTNCHATHFAHRFCEYMRSMKSDLPQKTQALNGFLQSLLLVPHGMENNLGLLLDLACSITSEPAGILGGMGQVLQKYAATYPAAWGAALKGCRSQQRTVLQRVYGI